MILFLSNYVNSQNIFWAERGASLRKFESATGKISTIYQTESNSSDWIEAIAINGETEEVFFSCYIEDGIKNLVKKTDLNGSFLEEILRGDDINGIKIDPTNSRLVFLTGSARFPPGQITWKSLQNGSSGIIYEESSPDRKDLEIDLINEKIYFSELGIGIQRIDFDGSNLEIVVPESQFSSISKIAIDQLNDKIFWIQTGIGDEILKANLDGSEIEKVVESNFLDGITKISDIAFESDASNLYWIGSKTNSNGTEYFLKRSDSKGENQLSILEHDDFENSPLALEVIPVFSSDKQPFQVKQYSIFRDNPLKDFNSDNTTDAFIELCADGSNSSYLDIIPTNPANVSLEHLQLRIREDRSNAEPDSYGTFSHNFTLPDANLKRFDFKHPLHIPGTTDFSFTHIVEIYNDITDEVLATFEMRLFRTPVLMVHGLWSNGSAFSIMKKTLEDSDMYDKDLLLVADYKNSNDLHFHVNDEKEIISLAIQDLISQVLDDSKRASGKVDIVAHSMGGILSRIYIQGESYQDNVRKLITCNTPHFGSQMANLILDDGFACISGFFCRDLMEEGDGSCYKGAVYDLQVDKTEISAISILNSASSEGVFIHPLVTTQNVTNISDDFMGGIPVFFKIGILSMLEFAINGVSNEADEFLTSRFNSSSHDIIVSENSQKGGLDIPLVSFITSQEHMGSVANTEVINEIRQLLSYNPKGDRFTENGYNNVSDEPDYEPVDLCDIIRPNASIKLNYPIEGKKVRVGEEIDFLVNASENVAKIRLMIENDDYQRSVYLKEAKDSSLSFTYKVSTLPLGKRRIFIKGYDQEGVPIESINSYLMVDVNEIPSTIETEDYSIQIILGTDKPISFFAEFENFRADISSLENIEYKFATGRASRLSNNRIRGDEIGEDFLTVKYKGLESLPVRINVINRLYPQATTSTKEENIPHKEQYNLIINKVFPNPTEDNFVIDFHSKEQQKVEIQVIGLDGRKVFSSISTANAGENLLQINMPNNSPKGFYIVSIRGNSSLQIAKFVKQ